MKSAIEEREELQAQGVDLALKLDEKGETSVAVWQHTLLPEQELFKGLHCTSG